jgi:HAE1 family hydrophobic/amphiphilic exporter-1/multidrug efflux pump
MTTAVILRITAPEGSSYEYTDRFMQEISKLVDDSIPAKKVSLVVTSPGFGSSSVNSGFVRLSLKNLVKESCLKKKLQKTD